MSSPYLNNTRSMEELDALLEESLRQASGEGNKLIADEVRDVIGSIGEVCKKSLAQIEEQTSKTVANVSSCVEIAKAEFLNETEAARMKIEALMDDPSKQRTVDILSSMISETSYLSLGRISKCADGAIKKIRSEASDAIVDLRKKVADSYKSFRAMAAKAANSIRGRVEKAAHSYAQAKKTSDGNGALKELKKETHQIISDAESASTLLEEAKAKTVEDINEAMQAASERIEKARKEAAEDIGKAKEAAEFKLNDLAKDALNRLAMD